MSGCNALRLCGSPFMFRRPRRRLQPRMSGPTTLGDNMRQLARHALAPWSTVPQAEHSGPFGHRTCSRNARHFASSLNRWWSAVSVSGSRPGFIGSLVCVSLCCAKRSRRFQRRRRVLPARQDHPRLQSRLPQPTPSRRRHVKADARSQSLSRWWLDSIRSVRL